MTLSIYSLAVYGLFHTTSASGPGPRRPMPDLTETESTNILEIVDRGPTGAFDVLHLDASYHLIRRGLECPAVKMFFAMTIPQPEWDESLLYNVSGGETLYEEFFGPLVLDCTSIGSKCDTLRELVAQSSLAEAVLLKFGAAGRSLNDANALLSMIMPSSTLDRDQLALIEAVSLADVYASLPRRPVVAGAGHVGRLRRGSDAH